MARKRVRSKFVAVLLSVFGGWFGLHRFYLGETSPGIFYIFLFVMTRAIGLPVTFFLGIFDAFRLLMMSPRRFDRLYNSGHEDGLQRRRTQGRTQKDLYEERKRQSRQRGVKRVNPYKSTGINKYKEYDIEGAIEDFEKGLKIEPNDVSLHFNLACGYSMQEEKDKSLYHLDKAIQNGYKDVQKIKTHDDLAFLRVQPEYEKFEANGYKLEGKINVKQDNLLEDDLLLSQLNKLAELRNKGLLSEEEFAREKNKLMRR